MQDPVVALLDLRAVDAAPLMERVFAGGRVAEYTNGDWEEVQIELGLKLRRERARKPNEFAEMGQKLRAALHMPEPREDEFGNPKPAVAWQPPVLPAPAFEKKLEPFRAPSKAGRNDPCPCGSGKKFKKCCGA